MGMGGCIKYNMSHRLLLDIPLNITLVSVLEVVDIASSVTKSSIESACKIYTIPSIYAINYLTTMMI